METESLLFSSQDLKAMIMPLFLEQLLMALVGIVDIFVVGFVGEAVVSGVSLSSFGNVQGKSTAQQLIIQMLESKVKREKVATASDFTF